LRVLYRVADQWVESRKHKVVGPAATHTRTQAA
jgi:hypothetical protein